MNDNKNINIIQYCSILIMLVDASFLGISIYTCIDNSGVDCWISILISLLIGITCIIIFNHINNFMPSKNLSKKIICLYGKKIGFIINLIITICFFSIFLCFMTNILIYIVSQFLTKTPLIFIGIIFVFLIIYINIKGIEVISRVSYIFIIINMLLFLISLFGLINNIDCSNLLPIAQNGIKPIFKSSFFIIIDNIIPIYVLLSIPKNKICNYKNLNKYVYFSFIYALLIMVIIVVATVGTLGIDLSKLYKYPEYIVLKNISLFGFLNNMENVFNIQWILGLFIMVSISLFAIRSNFQSNKNKNVVSIFTSIITLIIIKKVFINDSIFENYIHKIVPYFNVTLLIIMVVTSLLILIKNKTKN